MRTPWVVVFLIVLLAGCGSGGDSGAPAAGQSAAPTSQAPEAPPADLNELLGQADLARGKRMYIQCLACHSLKAGEPHKVGPNLHGMFARQAGTAEGFPAYSEALKSAGFQWTPEMLDDWLARC